MATVTLSGAAEWRIFPPPVKRSPLSIGDEVFVRTKSAKEVGKKGIICAFENVEVQVPAVAAPEPAGSAWPISKNEVPAGCGGGGSGGGDETEGAAGTRGREADKTIKWRDVKKQRKKKKKAKKWEDTRAVVRIPPRGNNGKGNGNPFDCRARPSRLVPIYSIPPLVDRQIGTAAVISSAPPPLLLLITAETAPYRVLAASQVRPSDRVLEIGCSTGETTVVLVKYIPRGNVVALDVGADMVERTKERLKLAFPGSSSGNSSSTCPRLAVHKIDPFLDPRGAVEAASALVPGRKDGDSSAESQADVGGGNAVAGACSDRGVDVVFIDIGGNREVRGVLRMIAFARTAFVRPPRLIVVKSQALVAELAMSPNIAKKTDDVDDEEDGGDDDDGATKAAAAATNIKPGSCAGCGKITEGDVWFRGLLASNSTTAAVTSSGDAARTTKEEAREEGASNGSSQHPNIPKHFHPNKAPLRLSPTDGVTPICRYHNYHREGCKKGERCPFEHAVCHWCLRPGHVALSCDGISEFSAMQ